MKRLVSLGALLLIALGILHAINVGRADDVEPYLWGASLFLILQGIATWALVRKLRDDPS
ncbi:MAG: hypothetical protein OEM91_10775 [Hyphomicrobiales bacterium]|nr:hypothetical protein [Hyphomicrobiales bacterium]